MKKLCGRVFAAIFTFTLGVVLGAGGLNSRQASVPSLNTSAAPSPSTNSDTSQNSVDSCFVLIDDNDFHPKLNGWNLPLSTEPLSDDEIDGVKLIPLSRGRSLVGVTETLILFDSQKRVIWEYDLPGGWLIDFDVVEATGLVYGTAGDNIMFILDLSSGKELEKIGRNGSAAYGDVKAYGKDLCLIRDDFRVYREKVPDPSFEPMKDRLAAWRGTQPLWEIDFPPDAELIVREKKIFALTKTKTRVYLKEVFAPKMYL